MPQARNPASISYLDFIKRSARALRQDEAIPRSRVEWASLRKSIRRKLAEAMGLPGERPQDVPSRVIRKQEQDGYTIEHLVLGTFKMPAGWVWMTANAYVPHASGRHPAVLCVHGHWSGAKQDPVVQARCIGLAKLGFLVLSVDAFGAGERGLKEALGEYHGEMVAATLWPTGTLLAGLQVWENMRAVDYLQSRPDVDPDKLGITGTSGGGNQTIYAGALEERFKCVVPVCSVGNYQAYLGAACCMCELVPGTLTFSEQWQVLGLVAPRALMVINATMDAFQFSVGEARKSVAGASRVFELFDRGDDIRHVIVESKHDYNQPMREAMYGWMTKHLKGQGDGSPIAEPKVTARDRESIRVWPGTTRPGDHVTLPQFASYLAASLMKRHVLPRHAEHWEAEAEWRVATLKRLCEPTAWPDRKGPETVVRDVDGKTEIVFETEPLLRLHGGWQEGTARPSRLAVLIDLGGRKPAEDSAAHRGLVKAGWDVAVLNLRATGDLAPRGNRVRRAVDHNSSQWGMWIGRPLITQWVTDIRRFLDMLDDKLYPGSLPPARLVGLGSAGVVAVAAAVVDRRIADVVSIGTPASVISDAPYGFGHMGILVPGSLKDIGDLPQVMSLLAPRRLTVVNPMSPTGKPLGNKSATEALRHPLVTYRTLGAASKIVVSTGLSEAETATAAAVG